MRTDEMREDERAERDKRTRDDNIRGGKTVARFSIISLCVFVFNPACEEWMRSS